MIALLQNYTKEAVTIGGVILAFVLNRLFRLRSKLLYSIRHSFNFIVDNPQTDAEGKVTPNKTIVRTASIFSQNTGLLQTKGVEYTFNWKPPVYNVAPARHFSTHVSDMDRFTIRLDSLAPSEAFSIEIMSFNNELPVMTAVRSDDVEGKLVNMRPTRQFPRWIDGLFTFLFAAGVAGTLYAGATFIQWIAR